MHHLKSLWAWLEPLRSFIARRPISSTVLVLFGGWVLLSLYYMNGSPGFSEAQRRQAALLASTEGDSLALPALREIRKRNPIFTNGWITSEAAIRHPECEKGKALRALLEQRRPEIEAIGELMRTKKAVPLYYLLSEDCSDAASCLVAARSFCRQEGPIDLAEPVNCRMLRVWRARCLVAAREGRAEQALEDWFLMEDFLAKLGEIEDRLGDFPELPEGRLSDELLLACQRRIHAQKLPEVAVSLQGDYVLNHLFTCDAQGRGHLSPRQIHLALKRDMRGNDWINHLICAGIPLLLPFSEGREDGVRRLHEIKAAKEAWRRDHRDAAAWQAVKLTVDYKAVPPLFKNLNLEVLPLIPRIATFAAERDSSFAWEEDLFLLRQRGLLLGLALHRYHLRQKHWPERLEGLIPLLPEAKLIEDPLTGGSLCYSLQSGAPRIWSKGTDLDDDGGKPFASAWHSRTAIGDEGFWLRGQASTHDGDFLLWPASPAVAWDPKSGELNEGERQQLRALKVNW
ncbi:MAG: hypothetical protein RL095_2046 [Verrucomicrobiota bacterium]|jgi:hypothetical protein